MQQLHVILVTGLSGAGRSTALHALEDLGFYCIDNLPVTLIPQLLETLKKTSAEQDSMLRIGLGVDVRAEEFFDMLSSTLSDLNTMGHSVEMVFLDCNDETLIRRYSTSRRPHPLAPEGNLLRAIERERERLADLRMEADQVFDTTSSSVHDLRQWMTDFVSQSGARHHMVTRIVSFGFKYGIPRHADLVFDLRYLPNPYFVPELKPMSGKEAPIADFVLKSAEAQELLQDLVPMLQRMIPRYEREGKAYLTVALGCTGGRHRSVATAEELAQRLRQDREVTVDHRDVQRAARG